MRNIKEESEVDWNYIFILDKFLTYFGIKLLKELSLISRFIRNKLRPILFAKSVLKGRELINYFDINSTSKNQVNQINIFTQNNDYMRSKQQIIDNVIQQLPNNSDLMLLAKDLNRELQRISGFIKSLKVQSLTYYFYELYSITFTLGNLVNLELYCCTVPLLKFMRIGEYLKKLVKLTLSGVRFIELTKQELSPEIFHFPCKFKNLNIHRCVIYVIDSTPNATNLFRIITNSRCFIPKTIQGFNIPGLKRLESCGDCISEYLFHVLLRSNPQVDTLIIDETLPNQRGYNQISLSKQLTNLEILCADIRFPHISLNWSEFIIPRFDSVNKLTLGFVEEMENGLYYDAEYRNITSYFPNLTHLTIILDCIDDKPFSPRNFLEVNLPFCNTLEMLTIVDYQWGFETSNYHGFNFNFENFTNVKFLILDLDTLPLSEINFNNFPSELKQVRKLYCDKQYQLEYIRNNPDRFRKWNIQFKDEFIYFTK